MGKLTNYGRFAVRAAQANFGRLQSPLKLNWALTYWCQYKCKTCNIWKLKPENELSTEEALRFIHRNRDFAWVDLTGGEIFLREDLPDILSALVSTWEHLIILHYPTNGFLTDRIVKCTEQLASHFRGKIVVTVSLDGDEQMNDRIRGIKGGYRRQMETFRALRSLDRVHVVLGMTLSHHNAGFLEQTFQSCKRHCPSLKPSEFHVNLMQASEHYYHNPEMATEKIESSRILTEMRQHQKMRGLRLTPSHLVESIYLRKMEAFLETERTPMKCHALRSSCFIDPWGKVYPCITYNRAVGDLRETNMDLSMIWSNSSSSQLQREIWDYQCPNCWTACEAYQSILGNLLRPGHWGDRSNGKR